MFKSPTKGNRARKRRQSPDNGPQIRKNCAALSPGSGLYVFASEFFSDGGEGSPETLFLHPQVPQASPASATGALRARALGAAQVSGVYC
jgi:hypothetical protein